MDDRAARRAAAEVVRECLAALPARGFTTRKRDAVRLTPIPCQVRAFTYRDPGDRGPAYDWNVFFANPGTPLRDGGLTMGLFDVSQAAQRGLLWYDLRRPEHLDAFRQDFLEHTLPFVDAATSHRRLLEVLAEGAVRVSPHRTRGAENVRRAKVALDLLAHGDLSAADAELAAEVVRRAIEDGPSVLVRAGVREVLEVTGYRFDLG